MAHQQVGLIARVRDGVCDLDEVVRVHFLDFHLGVVGYGTVDEWRGEGRVWWMGGYGGWEGGLVEYVRERVCQVCVGCALGGGSPWHGAHYQPRSLPLLGCVLRSEKRSDVLQNPSPH